MYIKANLLDFNEKKAVYLFGCTGLVKIYSFFWNSGYISSVLVDERQSLYYAFKAFILKWIIICRDSWW